MTAPLRPHRFPPLSQLTARVPATLPGHDLAGQQTGYQQTTYQQAVSDGFQQGMDKGYQDGFDSGVQRGQEAGREQGYQDGLQQGQEVGRRDALAAFDGLAAPLEATLAEVRRLQEDYHAALRKEVVDLVAKVARQVIRCELALQPSQLLSLVDETLAAMPPAPGGIEIYLPPDECQRLRELAPERVAGWTLIADPRLAHGECRVKAGDREADAGCNQRLNAVMDQIHAQLVEGEAPAAINTTTSTTTNPSARTEPDPVMSTAQPASTVATSSPLAMQPAPQTAVKPARRGAKSTRTNLREAAAS